MKRLVLVGVFGLLVMAGCSDGDDAASEEPAPSTTGTSSSTTSTTTTTTIAPEDIEPIDEGFDIDREVAPGAEAESLGPIGTTETTIATSEGEVSIGGGEVPELAADFPLPEGFEVQLATEVPGELGFSGRVDGVLAELVAFYDSALPAAGYEIIERQEVPGILSALVVEGPLEGDVVISEEPGGDGWTLLIALQDPDAVSG